MCSVPRPSSLPTPCRGRTGRRRRVEVNRRMNDGEMMRAKVVEREKVGWGRKGKLGCGIRREG